MIVYAKGERTIPYPREKSESADSKSIKFFVNTFRDIFEIGDIIPGNITVGDARDTLVSLVHELREDKPLHAEIYIEDKESLHDTDLDNVLAYNLNRNRGVKYDLALQRGAIMELRNSPIKGGKVEYLFYRSEDTFIHWTTSAILTIPITPLKYVTGHLKNRDLEKKLLIWKQTREKIIEKGINCEKIFASPTDRVALDIETENISSSSLKVIIDGIMGGLCSNLSGELLQGARTMFGNKVDGLNNLPGEEMSETFDPRDELDRLVALRVRPSNTTKVTVYKAYPSGL